MTQKVGRLWSGEGAPAMHHRGRALVDRSAVGNLVHAHQHLHLSNGRHLAVAMRAATASPPQAAQRPLALNPASPPSPIAGLRGRCGRQRRRAFCPPPGGATAGRAAWPAAAAPACAPPATVPSSIVRSRIGRSRLLGAALPSPPALTAAGRLLRTSLRCAGPLRGCARERSGPEGRVPLV